jgi:uncharacterized membrane protein
VTLRVISTANASPVATRTSRRSVILLALILLGALAIRLRNLETPLWLDEIYSYRMARLSFDAIIANSFSDPHPPGYYLLQWLITDSGKLKSEIALRWLSVIAGVFCIVPVWKVTRKLASDALAIVPCVIMAALPSLVFYSQEDRSYSLCVFLAAATVWLVTIMPTTRKRRVWFAWVALSLLGAYLSYSYMLVLGIQVIVLSLTSYRRPEWWVSGLLLAAASAPLIPLTASLGARAQIFATIEPLTSWRILQATLAGEPLRYGLSWAHIAMPVLMIVLFPLGTKRAVAARDDAPRYVALQAIAPLVLYAALAEPLGINLPLSETKQFLVLLPAALVVATAGLAKLIALPRFGRRFHVGLIAAVLALTIAANFTGLQAYWSIPKSPEGMLVTRLKERLQPGDLIVSLHYSVSYAIGFYTEGITLYTNHRPMNGGFDFKSIESGDFLGPARPRNAKNVDDARARKTFWLVAHVTDDRDAFSSLTTGCATTRVEIFQPFEAILVECP